MGQAREPAAGTDHARPVSAERNMRAEQGGRQSLREGLARAFRAQLRLRCWRSSPRCSRERSRRTRGLVARGAAGGPGEDTGHTWVSVATLSGRYRARCGNGWRCTPGSVAQPSPAFTPPPWPRGCRSSPPCSGRAARGRSAPGNGGCHHGGRNATRRRSWATSAAFLREPARASGCRAPVGRQEDEFL